MKETGQIMPEDKENFMNQESQTPHKRRVRYKGKYPKKFEEKYKELQPEKYKDTIEHVIQKGNTPAGMHISIMVKEILDFLNIQPGETGFDATLGYGGHTKAMLQCLNGKGHIYATDVDPEESAKTKKRLAEQGFGEELLTVKLQNFCTIDEIAKEVGGFDFILADLGVSSMQIDNPKRGFSFKTDGPLDLRLNQETGISAAQRLDTISREELAGMLCENSDEPYCEELAKAITDEIRRGNHYDAIIMDPPSYGRGPKGEIWKIEDAIHPLIKLCAKLLSDDPLFFLVNSYTTGLAPAVLTYMIATELKPFNGHVDSQEIGLPVRDTGLVLPCGASGRWER